MKVLEMSGTESLPAPGASKPAHWVSSFIRGKEALSLGCSSTHVPRERAESHGLK